MSITAPAGRRGCRGRTFLFYQLALATLLLVARSNANVRRLRTLPGIGEFFARLIDAEIDDIAYLRSAAKLAAYAGLVPSTYSSGGKTFHGRIIKRGNKWLRWAFVEAVAAAVFCDPDMTAYYQRLKATRGANRAKVVTARRLLTIAFVLLRDARSCERRGASPTGEGNLSGCPDGLLASPAMLGCALEENGTPGPNATL